MTKTYVFEIGEEKVPDLRRFFLNLMVIIGALLFLCMIVASFTFFR